MCRLSTPYRVTTDLDTVDRRAAEERPQLELLVSAGAIPSGPSGALVHTPYGEVQVDVLEVTEAEIDDLPSDPTGRLHVQSHAWAASTASGLVLSVEGLEPLTVRVSEPGPIAAMKLQAVSRDRRLAILMSSLSVRRVVPRGNPGRILVQHLTDPRPTSSRV
jgi:hypothetical protein